jgi:prepilin-type N-terminal cleavage/methylation domain-containing protein
MTASARRAFTILEVLVAIALVGLVLVALNTFIFSMGELWGKGSDSRLFDQHVRAVTRFLERELRTAGFPPNVIRGTAAFAARETRAASGLSAPLLTFELAEGSRLLVWPDTPLPEVVCALAVRDGAGLLLLWQSRLETRFEEDPPRETVISPLVTGIRYEYYEADFKSWRSESLPRRVRSGEGYEAPQRLRLTFSHGAFTRESTVSLPVVEEGLPLF